MVEEIKVKTKIRVNILLECEEKDLQYCKGMTNKLISDFVSWMPADIYHKISMTTPRELDDDIPF